MAEVSLETRGKNFVASLRRGAEVVVGGESDLTFRPTIALKRWGEVGAELRVPTAKNITPAFDGSRLTWRDGDIAARYYILPDGDGDEDDAFEFEFILFAPPAVPTLDVELDLSRLDLFFQPPLTRSERERGNIRPARVVNSFAAYHAAKSPLHTLAGAADKYRAGKAFHIYRPEAIDAAGNRRWCGYLLVGSTLKIVLDTAWLATAAYPVVVDPTIGYSTLGASLDGTNNYMLANNQTAPQAGDANPGTAFVGGQCGSGTTICMFGAYVGGGAAPDGKALLATSGQITITTTLGFRSAAITWTGITATDYWLSINQQTGASTAYDAGLDVFFAGRTHANDMPSTWPANEGSASYKISMYVDYAASGGGGGALPPLRRDRPTSVVPL